MLDDGYLTDSLGRTIDFRNCLVILTSNTGARQVQEFGQGVGFKSSNTVAQQQNAEKGILMKALNHKFAPEFLNRIDEIIIFNKLQEEDILKILDLECNSLIENLKEVGDYQLKISRAAKDILVKEGYDPKFGARPLRRTVERLIENPIAEMILKGEIKEGDTVKISGKGGEISITKG